MITELVTNGCSYMHTYVEGNGHADLANRLNLKATDISISGSANSRIIRTTLKHSYETDNKCLYVLGMTFISREELPICRYDPGIYPTVHDIWEGAWTNPQNQHFGKNRWKDWTDNDTKQWVLFREKYESGTIVDRIENLMYQMLAMIDSLTSRGHNCIIYQQADKWWDGMMPDDYDRVQLLEHKNIICNFKWCAVREQHRAGVPYVPDEEHVEPEVRHRLTGAHEWLNNYLESHIRKHELHL
jgi:hypothetical protein